MAESDSANELVCFITKDARGIGKKTTIAMAAYFDTFEDFLGASEADLRGLKTKSGKQQIRDEAIKDIMELKAPVRKGTPVKKVWVSVLATDFLKRQIKMLEGISLDTLVINPMLSLALNLDTPEQIVRFNLYQSVTRSIVTSWGNCVETMVRFTGGERINDKNSGFDLKKKTNGKEYFIQIKSGPNTMNVDMVRYLNTKIEQLEQNANKVGRLGLTYGRKEQVSHQIKGYLDNPDTRILAGRELWDFISGQKDYYKDIMNIIQKATDKVTDESFSDLFDKKMESILKEWETRYGTGPASIKKALDQNI